MEVIRDLRTVQIRIFPTDVLPIGALRRTSAIELFKQQYGFELQRLPEPIPIDAQPITFVNGELGDDDTRILVDRLVIEERRVLLTISGPSKSAERVFESVAATVASLDHRDPRPDYMPIVKTDETTCIAKLEVSFDTIFEGSKVQSFADSIREAAPSHGSTIAVFPSSLKFRISYSGIPSTLAQRRVSLVDKFFVIEQRERSAPEERVFFTSSPTDSETHISLIKRLEALAGSA